MGMGVRFFVMLIGLTEILKWDGGRYKDRTCDLRLVRPPLSQLS